MSGHVFRRRARGELMGHILEIRELSPNVGTSPVRCGNARVAGLRLVGYWSGNSGGRSFMNFEKANPQWAAAECKHGNGFAMACPRCTTQAHFKPIARADYLHDAARAWRISIFACTSCNGPVVLMAHGAFVPAAMPLVNARRVNMIEPASVQRPAPHVAVPAPWRDEYIEAASIQVLSPKSAAALLRRIVDGMLREKTPPATVHQMIEAMRPPALPDYVWNGLHDLRDFGNWGAHPKWTNVGQLVEIEPSEVDMCFEVVDAMFDHWYVGPKREVERQARVAERKAAGLKNTP